MLSSGMFTPMRPDMRKSKIKAGPVVESAGANIPHENTSATIPGVKSSFQGGIQDNETAIRICKNLAQSTPGRVAPLIIRGTNATSYKITDAKLKKTS